MAIIVQERETLNYVGSPQIWPDGDFCWPMFADINQAHEFKNRKEAKAAIRSFDKSKPVELNDYKFILKE